MHIDIARLESEISAHRLLSSAHSHVSLTSVHRLTDSDRDCRCNDAIHIYQFILVGWWHVSGIHLHQLGAPGNRIPNTGFIVWVDMYIHSVLPVLKLYCTWLNARMAGGAKRMALSDIKWKTGSLRVTLPTAVVLHLVICLGSMVGTLLIFVGSFMSVENMKS
jgi:hypothetical protein